MKKKSILLLSIIIILFFASIRLDPLRKKEMTREVMGDEGGVKVGYHRIIVTYLRADISDDHDSGWIMGAGEWYFKVYSLQFPSEAWAETGEILVDGPSVVEVELTLDYYISGDSTFECWAGEKDTGWDYTAYIDVNVALPGTLLNEVVWGKARWAMTDDVAHEYEYTVFNAGPQLISASGPASGYRSTSYLFTASATDPEGDSMTYEWLVDGVAQSSTGSSMSYTFPNSAPIGAHTISVRALDALGGYSVWVDKTLTLLSAPASGPTGSIVINRGDSSTASDSVTLSLTYTDADSGVSQVRYSNDGIWDSEAWEAPAATRAWTLMSGAGEKTVYYQVKNNAGLTSLTYSDTIILSTSGDNVKPTADAGPNQETRVGWTVFFDGSASSDNFGIVGYYWSFGDHGMGTGKTATHTYASAGTYTATLTVKDQAGNSATDTVTVIVSDGVEPMLPWIMVVIIVSVPILVLVMLLWRGRRKPQQRDKPQQPPASSVP